VRSRSLIFKIQLLVQSNRQELTSKIAGISYNACWLNG